ncbi:MAG: hypothetical protein M1281_20540 [Chloroflexi bacterium]|nr:hypothetical protein [Chloroflexota bacterium]
MDLQEWIQRVRNNASISAEMEALPLRRDMLTLLTYIKVHRVIGTQSLGNFPLKAIREITQDFIHPPALDIDLGGQSFRMRSEDDIWPLSFLHILADAGALLDGGPNRQIRLTAEGEKYLAIIPPLQVWYLLATWWARVDWLCAYPFSGMGETLPANFKKVTLKQLLEIPPEIPMPFQPFADELIQETGLTWISAYSDFSTIALHSSIEAMVLHVLENFGILEVEYLSNGKTPSQLMPVSFAVTKLGRDMLQTLVIPK